MPPPTVPVVKHCAPVVFYDANSELLNRWNVTDQNRWNCPVFRVLQGGPMVLRRGVVGRGGPVCLLLDESPENVIF